MKHRVWSIQIRLLIKLIFSSILKHKEIEYLIAKSFKGELNQDEKSLLNEWMVASVKNKKKFEEYLRLWKKSETLVLSDAIDIESSLGKTKKRIKEFESKKRRNFYFKQIAAILLLSISLASLYNYFFNRAGLNGSEEIVFQEVKAAYGTQTKLFLADGTNVWLNSGSTLRFPISFKNMDERKVELNGEGYFEVTKNDTKPFIVKGHELDVKVYGTSFNVSAYKEYNSMVVALVEGKVGLVKDYNGKQTELMVLEPNNVAEFNVESNTLKRREDVKMNKYTAWRDGYIVFYGDPIDKVVQRLEKWYNVDIEIGDKTLRDYRFTATLYDESLEQVLSLLSLSSPMQYKITPAQKQPDNTYSMRKVTLTMKR